MPVSFSESDASFWVSVCSQASLVAHPDTGRDELSWVRGSVTSSQNTHAHSAWAVAAEVSRERARSIEALRASRVIGATSGLRIGLRTIFDPCPLDGVAGGCFGSREFAVPDPPLAFQNYQTDCP